MQKGERITDELMRIVESIFPLCATLFQKTYQDERLTTVSINIYNNKIT